MRRVAIANSTRYGWQQHLRLDAVAVHLHQRAAARGHGPTSTTLASATSTKGSFGGVKKSGYGRFAGREGLLGVTQAKAVYEGQAVRVGQDGYPGRLDYPMVRRIRAALRVRAWWAWRIGEGGGG